MRLRHALWLLGLVFAASAAIRLGNGLGLLARAAETAAVLQDDSAATAVCPPQPAALAAAFSAREARILAQEAAMAQRLAALDLSQQALDAKMQALTQMEDQLRQVVALSDGAAEADLSRLTAVYEAMKPRDAAALFETMEPAFAAGFLGRMRPDLAAGVLAAMPAKSAYAASAILAGRNAMAPDH